MMNKNLSSLTIRFLQSMDDLGLTGYGLQKDGVVNSSVTISHIRGGKQEPSRKLIDAYCEKYGVDKVWLETGFDVEGANFPEQAKALAENFIKEGTEQQDLPEINKRFLTAISEDYANVTGYRLKKEGIIGSESTLTNIKRGSQQPSRKTIDLLCEKYNISKLWLYTGDGTPMVGDDEKSPKEVIVNSLGTPVFQNVVYVPVNAAASFVESLYTANYDKEYYGVMPEEGELLDETYTVFQVSGDSMEPTIPNGAKILTKRVEEGYWETASGVVVIVYGKTLAVKRILKNGLYMQNVLTLKADNPIHGQLDVERCEIRGMWKALRIISQKIM